MNKIQILVGLLALICSSGAVPEKIEADLYQNLHKSPLTNALITFKKADVENIHERFDYLAKTLRSRDAKLNILYSLLKDHADAVQGEVTTYLHKERAASKSHLDLRQLWMSAELIVRDIDRETLERLAQFESVESIQAEKFIPLEPVERRELNPEEVTPNAQWGVNMVRAEAVWNTGNRGEGIVVANIDTGVRHTHQALRSNYRGTVQNTNNYNWYAPTGKASTPSDSNGHGTHTMGSIAGTANGIGVAPGAHWVACKGCGSSSCSNFDLRECGNWAGCPTNTAGGSPDCSKAPHLVSNSWGGGQGQSWYDSIINAWRRVGIAPLFSAGNSGPNCRTANSPADRSIAISIGSTTSGDQVSSFSSVGPTTDGRMKPDVAAPGSSIVSASHSSDSGYATMSGTSMACPHAAGVSALLYKKNPNLTADQVKNLLVSGAQRVRASGKTCSGVSDSQYPNHHVGAGRVDALASVNALLMME